MDSMWSVDLAYPSTEEWWSQGNDLVNEVIKAAGDDAEWESSGTGFGFRDIQIRVQTRAIGRRFVREVKERFKKAGIPLEYCYVYKEADDEYHEEDEA